MTAHTNNERSGQPYPRDADSETSVPSAGVSSAGVRADRKTPHLPVAVEKPSEDGRQKARTRIPWFRPTAVNVKLIYAGYLISLALPLIAIFAALCAHQAAKQNPPHWLATHYTYQLRTFWIGLVANLAAYGLSFAGVGLLLFPLIAVWVVARAVKGLIRIAQQVEIEEPNSYFV